MYETHFHCSWHPYPSFRVFENPEPFTLVRHRGVTVGCAVPLWLLLSAGYSLTPVLQHKCHPCEDTSSVHHLPSQHNRCHHSSPAHNLLCLFPPGLAQPRRWDALAVWCSVHHRNTACNGAVGPVRCKGLRLNRGAWQVGQVAEEPVSPAQRCEPRYTHPFQYSSTIKPVLFYSRKHGLTLQAKGWTNIPTLNMLLLRHMKSGSNLILIWGGFCFALSSWFVAL